MRELALRVFPFLLFFLELVWCFRLGNFVSSRRSDSLHSFAVWRGCWGYVCCFRAGDFGGLEDVRILLHDGIVRQRVRRGGGRDVVAVAVVVVVVVVRGSSNIHHRRRGSAASRVGHGRVVLACCVVLRDRQSEVVVMRGRKGRGKERAAAVSSQRVAFPWRTVTWRTPQYGEFFHRGIS